MMWPSRVAMPKRSSFAVAQFDTLRLRLIKIARHMVGMKTRIRLHLGPPPGPRFRPTPASTRAFEFQCLFRTGSHSLCGDQFPPWQLCVSPGVM